MRKRYAIWININSLILATLIWNTLSISKAGDDDPAELGISYEELKCIQSCYNEWRKLCVRPPAVCGECVDNHVNIDGICRARTIAVAESVPNVKRQLEEALERERHKKELDGGTEGGGGGESNMLAGDGKVRTHDTRDEGEYYPPSDNGGSESNSVVIDDAVFIGVIAAFCSAAVIGIVVAIICYCKLRRSAKDASEMDYGSSYGSSLVGGGKGGLNDSYPTKPPAVDRKLAQSAQMFHYQHQKQQMLEMEKAAEVAAKSDEEATSEDDNADDHYTVYECPGLASTGEMEVRNPLYMEDSPLPPSVTSTPPPPPLGVGDQGPPSNCLDPVPTTTTSSGSGSSGSLVNGHHGDKH